MKGIFNDRPVEVTMMHYASDPVDCFIEEAYYIDTEKDLTDEECQAMTDQSPELVQEMWNEYQIDRADALLDSWKDSQYGF